MRNGTDRVDDHGVYNKRSQHKYVRIHTHIHARMHACTHRVKVSHDVQLSDSGWSYLLCFRNFFRAMTLIKYIVFVRTFYVSHANR